jgi:hypothetical protein
MTEAYQAALEIAGPVAELRDTMDASLEYLERIAIALERLAGSAPAGLPGAPGPAVPPRVRDAFEGAEEGKRIPDAGPAARPGT